MGNARAVSLMFVILLAIAGRCFAQDTPHFDVVAEYVRELGATKGDEDVAKSDYAQEGNRLMDAIRNATRAKLTLATNISALQRMRVGGEYDTLLPMVVYWYKKKTELYDQIINIATAFSADKPRENVDYGQLAAQMAKISPLMDYADESLFKLTPLFFALLIDERPDAENHLSRLTITKVQGKQLVDSIASYFGTSLDEKNQNWTVSAASVLKFYLTKKGYRFSDE